MGVEVENAGGMTAAGPSGQDVSDHLHVLLCGRELLDVVLYLVAEEASLGDRVVKNFIFVGLPHIRQVQPWMKFLDHHSGHRLAKGPCSDFRRT